MLLDDERYSAVIAYGKEAVGKMKENNIDEGFTLAEQGWKAFPESGAKWNQGYNYAKSFFKHAIENSDMVKAKLWLDRMVENNDELHLYDSEVEHMKAKYEFEVGNLDAAFELWKNLLKQKGVGNRYFQSDNPKYQEFYQSRK